MKRTSYTILLITIIGIGTIGFLGIGLMDHNGSQLCPFSSTTCPPVNNAFFVALHHISGLTGLNEINISSIGVLSILLLLLVVFIKTQEPTIQPIHLKRPKNNEPLVIPYIKQLLFWLALHNKRDSHLAALVRSEP